MNPKVLITGSSGQLGQEFCAYFAQKSVAFTAKNSSELDITDFEKLSSVFKKVKPDIVINCAAYTRVDEAESEDGQKKADRVNNEAISTLVKVCRKNGAKLVHFSTDYIFDGTIDSSNFYDENARPNPLNKYGNSKLLGDNELMASNISFLIIRVAWLAGAYGNNFIKAIHKKVKTDTHLSIVDDQISTPSFTHDVVEKTWELALRNIKGVFNVAASTSCNRVEYTQAMLKFWGISDRVFITPIKTSSLNAAAERPLVTPLSTKKVAEVLGFPIKKWDVLLQESLIRLQEVESNND
jgi:dTDP-4-dehydrorhamnose reductase